MRIPLLIDRVCAAPPEQVLAAIRHAGEWRESAMPEEFRRRQLIALRATVRPPRFRLEFVGRGRRYEAPRVDGRVLPHPDGARVVARCGRSRWGFLPALVFSALGLWSAVPDGEVEWWFVAFTLLFWIAASFSYYSLPEEGDRQAQYLIARLHESLDRLATPAAPSKAG